MLIQLGCREVKPVFTTLRANLDQISNTLSFGPLNTSSVVNALDDMITLSASVRLFMLVADPVARQGGQLWTSCNAWMLSVGWP